jgi:hypothetical protein
MAVVTLVMWLWWNHWVKHLTFSKSKADVLYSLDFAETLIDGCDEAEQQG